MITLNKKKEIIVVCIHCGKKIAKFSIICPYCKKMIPHNEQLIIRKTE